MAKDGVSFIQDQIGYTFRNTDLLRQAFVRRSYAEENGGEGNEVLEFIGDTVLDMVVVKLLAEKYGSFTPTYKEWPPRKDYNEYLCRFREDELTRRKQGLVNNKMLASKIEQLGLAEYLIMGKGDVRNGVNEITSVRGDLFEAIIGAVALDCGWNMEELRSVVEVMLDPDSFLEGDGSGDYLELVRDWSLKRYGVGPEFENYDVHEDSIPLALDAGKQVSMPEKNISQYNAVCDLRLGEFTPSFRGFGQTKGEARRAVCRFAYEYLEEKGLLFTIRDEIRDPNEGEAITQLETLSRRGYFSIPTYDFKQSYNKKGNPMWTCTCRVKEIEKRQTVRGLSSKKTAKKQAAYAMLRYVLEEWKEN